jgi:DedD protein
MGLAFWRSGKRAANAGGKPATRPPLVQDDDADARLDPAAGLRTRARHRLIGAAALLLAAAIVVPMVLDPDPKPVSENIPIDIPSERTPFTPRLSLPPVPAADAAGTPPPDQAPPAGKADAKAETKPAAKVDTKSEVRPATSADAAAAPKPEAKAADSRTAQAADARPAKGDETRVAKVDDTRKPSEAPAATPSAKSGKFGVQAAAPASEKAARDLVDRLKKGGFTAYTEKAETKDGTRYRVRIGPYATRDDAEKARARLKSQGINGNLVTL